MCTTLLCYRSMVTGGYGHYKNVLFTNRLYRCVTYLLLRYSRYHGLIINGNSYSSARRYKLTLNLKSTLIIPWVGMMFRGRAKHRSSGWISLILGFRQIRCRQIRTIRTTDWKVSICNEGNHFRRTSRVLIS